MPSLFFIHYFNHQFPTFAIMPIIIKKEVLYNATLFAQLAAKISQGIQIYIRPPPPPFLTCIQRVYTFSTTSKKSNDKIITVKKWSRLIQLLNKTNRPIPIIKVKCTQQSPEMHACRKYNQHMEYRMRMAPDVEFTGTPAFGDLALVFVKILIQVIASFVE